MSQGTVGDGVDHLPVGDAGRHALLVGWERFEDVGPVRELPLLHPADLLGQFGMLGLVPLERLEPLVPGRAATRPDELLETLANAVGDEELRIGRPSIGLLGESDLLLAQRLAVGGRGVLLVRRAPADVAVDDDHRRTVVGLVEGLEGVDESVDVVRIADPQDVPAVPANRVATSSL